MTGNLYRATFKLLHIELGSDQPLTSQPYEYLNSLTTKPIAKQIWKFLYEENIQLIIDIKMPTPREGDCKLMKILQEGDI
jgi:hypothetical protein